MHLRKADLLREKQENSLGQGGLLDTETIGAGGRNRTDVRFEARGILSPKRLGGSFCNAATMKKKKELQIKICSSLILWVNHVGIEPGILLNCLCFTN